jgi:hypothetical protein
LLQAIIKEKKAEYGKGQADGAYMKYRAEQKYR